MAQREEKVSAVELKKIKAEESDRPFNPFRCANSDRLRAILEDITKQVESYERRFYTRVRTRKAKDQANFEATIEAIVCDVAYQYLVEPGQLIHISLSKKILGRKSRYRSPAQGKKLPDILKYLCAAEMAFVEMKMGTKGRGVSDDDTFQPLRKRTTLWAGEKLISRIEEYEIDFSDFARSEHDETIILKAAKSGPFDKGEKEKYEDTETTHFYRHQLKTINRWLAKADITVLDEWLDPYDRYLRRYFNEGKFDIGGRLFGGFWLPMNKDQRLSNIKISGDDIAELDFGQMSIRLLYGMVDKTPPEGDLYNIPGLGHSERLREIYRPGIKLVFNAMLYSSAPLSRMPKGGRQYFPKWVTFSEIIRAISTHHSEISDQFFTGIGMKAMFMESEILIAVLLDLIERGITALPIHDAILVAATDAKVAQGVMLKKFKALSGVSGTVTVETG